MSLSGRRPAVVVSESSRNRAPVLGPRWTTSSADPSGSASMAVRSVDDSPDSAASGASGTPTGDRDMVVSGPLVPCPGAGEPAA